MNKLLLAYSGENAVNYDVIRSKSSRWKNEVIAMETYLDEIKPKVTLDCPFGTGRWVPQYHKVKTDVIGVDLSAGMLQEAQTKIDKLTNKEQLKFTLIKKSIFDLTRNDIPKTPDLVACIRFLNWVSFKDVKQIISTLSKLESKEMIVGASVITKGSSFIKKSNMSIALRITNLRAYKKPPQFVHCEEELLANFNVNGWKVIDQMETFRNSSRVNYFYRLVRK